MSDDLPLPKKLVRYLDEKPADEPTLRIRRRLEASLGSMEEKRREALDLLRHDVPMRETEEIGRALNGISGAIAHARAVVEDQLGRNRS